MFQWLADIRLKWRLRRLRAVKKEQPPAWDSIKSLALILADEPSFSKNSIDNFIEKTGKYVEVFFLQINQREPLYADWRCLTQKDQNASRLPKRPVLAEVKQKQFDLVINTCEENRYAVLLSASIPAGLHCSASTRYNESELVIKRTQNLDLPAYLEQVLGYLKMIRSGK